MNKESTRPPGEQPPRYDDAGPRNIIMLVDLFAGSARRIELSRYFRSRPLRELLREFAPSLLDARFDTGVVFSLTRRMILRMEDSPSENMVGDGDVLLFGDQTYFEAADSGLDQPETCLSFEEAQDQVRHFRPQSYIPQSTRCVVSDEEYSCLLHEMIATLPQHEEFPDHRLIAEINGSIDENLRRAPARVSLMDQVRRILQASESVSPCEIRSFLDCCPPGRPDLDPHRRLRFIGNTAALHLKPAPDIDSNILSLAEKGLIRIGEIVVYNGPAPQQADETSSEGKSHL